mmetsp:Transcript_1321/g.1702  ORF Transcript_1321/g.1702 Transcript_1321/m.1702 type:complete len:211 (-) Transcript_1321:348-980(-)
MASFSLRMMLRQMMLNSYRICEMQVSFMFELNVFWISRIFFTASVGIHSLASLSFFFSRIDFALLVSMPNVSQMLPMLCWLRYLAFRRMSVSLKSWYSLVSLKSYINFSLSAFMLFSSTWIDPSPLRDPYRSSTDFSRSATWLRRRLFSPDLSSSSSSMSCMRSFICLSLSSYILMSSPLCSFSFFSFWISCSRMSISFWYCSIFSLDFS